MSLGGRLCRSLVMREDEVGEGWEGEKGRRWGSTRRMVSGGIEGCFGRRFILAGCAFFVSLVLVGEMIEYMLKTRDDLCVMCGCLLGRLCRVARSPTVPAGINPDRPDYQRPQIPTEKVAGVDVRMCSVTAIR